jgi:MGT family glycosyltransferase
MRKGFFISLPSTSINNTLIPILKKITSEDYEIIYYNTTNPYTFLDEKLTFRKYPYYKGGYNSNSINSSTTYYELAEILLETTLIVTNYLMKEVEKEEPDFILHPHLGLWGKLIASYYNLPAIMLSTTFIMDKEIMVPYYKKFQQEKEIDFKKIKFAMRFYKKASILSKKLKFNKKFDIWDANVNKEPLNLSFILKELQPNINNYGREFKFLGYPLSVTPKSISHGLIYISLGTILNKDLMFYRLCIKVLAKLKINSVLAVGNEVNINVLGKIPKNIIVLPFVDQINTLVKSILFITSGGMGSVNESIYTSTPMIVIPQTTEQKITAQRIEELGIGIHLNKESLNELNLEKIIKLMLKNISFFSEKLLNLTSGISKIPTENLAFDEIDSFLNHSC